MVVMAAADKREADFTALLMPGLLAARKWRKWEHGARDKQTEAVSAL
jgi:hypothetical protein